MENVLQEKNTSFNIITMHMIQDIIYLMISPYNLPYQDIITKNKIRFMWR